MSATVARIGLGIKMGYASTVDGDPTYLAEIQEIKPGGTTIEKVKIYRSDANVENSTVPFPDVIPGWGEHADDEIKITYSYAAASPLYALVGVPGYWTLAYPAGEKKGPYASFISDMANETPLKEGMTCMIKVAASNTIANTAS